MVQKVCGILIYQIKYMWSRQYSDISYMWSRKYSDISDEIYQKSAFDVGQIAKEWMQWVFRDTFFMRFTFLKETHD